MQADSVNHKQNEPIRQVNQSIVLYRTKQDASCEIASVKMNFPFGDVIDHSARSSCA